MSHIILLIVALVFCWIISEQPAEEGYGPRQIAPEDEDTIEDGVITN